MSSIKTFSENLLVPYASSGRSHKLIVLPNGILTLLISDPAEDLASAALCVAAGAHNDPEDIPGLAHFCEHLILLGSKDFPNSNEFHDCISKAGGRRNAFTTGEQTCFYFETPSDSTWKSKNSSVEEPVFNHLLKVFASCLKAPTFAENMFEKEIYAVDNEHTSNKNSGGRLMYHGTRLISNQEHPFHRFATGSFFTLNDLPKIKKLKVKDHLLSYYQDNFVSEKMTLVIRGSQSINLLQKLAISNFADIRSSTELSKKDYDITSAWNYETQIFTQKEQSNCILIEKDQTPTLRLLFPVHSDSNDSTRSKQTLIFLKAWTNIVGDEGEGSLDAFLKKTDTITSLSAFTQHLARDNDMLVLELKLTNTGAKKVGEIIDLVFTEYLPKVFEDEVELGRVLSELESIDLLTYLHQDTYNSPMEESSAYAQSLQGNISSLGPENILKGSPSFTEIKQGFFESKIGQDEWTNKGQAFKSFLLGSSTALVDENFNFHYTIGKLSFSFPRFTQNPVFHLVNKNIFIPPAALELSSLRKLAIEASIKSSQSSLSYNTKSSWSTTKAALVQKGDCYEIWTKYETSQIFSSRLVLSFDIIYTSMESTVENTMNVEILSEILKIKFAEKLYAAELLDYTWEIFASLKGDCRIGFTISGFRDGVEALLSTIVSEFRLLKLDSAVSTDEFRKSRVAVRSRYRELTEAPSVVLASTGLLVVMEENIWSLEDRLDALDDIDAKSFKQFISDFSEGSKFLRLFVQGDIQTVDNLSVTLSQITNHLGSSRDTKFKEPSTVLLAPGSSYFIERSSSEGDPMNSISYFIQTGPRGDKYSEILTKLYSYLMSLTLVPDLRTKKQLGYVVMGGQRILRSTIGLHITVMSAGFTPKYLEHKINEYLLSWEKSLENMSDSEFQEQIINPYLKNFKQTLESSGGPESLTADLQASVSSSNFSEGGESSKSHRHLRELIFTGAYDPTSTEQDDINFMSNLKKDEFMKFFQQRISPSSKTSSKISIMLKSRMSSDEIQQQMMRLQLEAFLKMHGLRISSDKLKEIVEKSGGSSVSLLKDLFKFFMSQGESFKLCTVVLKEVVKQVSEGVKSYRNSAANLPENSQEVEESTQIKDIAEFQKSNKIFYR
ncbi:unnamed protein product [Wickerhamomyces anomalus]